MNGADLLISTLIANEVTTCFANPGTSEMQFVAALDHHPQMRSVLCLFEGVATGAADGYGRIAQSPACTLLHLGPGYGNGLANLHNARRAFTPIVNIIGDHATGHRSYDAPLHSDIEGIAAPNSLWVRSAETADSVALLAAEAISASLAPPGGPVSLILPADAAWNKADAQPTIAQRRSWAGPAPEALGEAARRIRAAGQPVVLIGGHACSEAGLAAAARIAATGVRVVADTFIARLSRGAGRFAPHRIPYFGELAMEDLAGADLMVLAGTTQPVAFFAYPDRPSLLVPDGASLCSIADRREDAVAALEALADTLGAPSHGSSQPYDIADAAPRGALTPHTAGVSIARHMPEGAIVCDDSVTSRTGLTMPALTAAPHEVLAVTGGAIGEGLPLAIGAALAGPQRKVISMNGDGAAMYTVQSLWTMARERLDILVIIMANGSYRILNNEMARTSAGDAGPRAARLLDLGDPRIGWVDLARGLGVEALRCDAAETFDAAVAQAMRQRGPFLIEAVI
ncbi:acetolactate synthase large subunit [Sphingosinicella xenopeptidilytica]|uniref:Acetolactate synthase large subunit n=1 Tax=Sphingosinicella xenopeptidilytica TaxID=364098 RepID=A0ABW3C3R7_SPHXN